MRRRIILLSLLVHVLHVGGWGDSIHCGCEMQSILNSSMTTEAVAHEMKRFLGAGMDRLQFVTNYRQNVSPCVLSNCSDTEVVRGSTLVHRRELLIGPTDTTIDNPNCNWYTSTTFRMKQCTSVTWTYTASGVFSGFEVKWISDKSDSRDQSDTTIITIAGVQQGASMTNEITTEQSQQVVFAAALTDPVIVITSVSGTQRQITHMHVYDLTLEIAGLTGIDAVPRRSLSHKHWCLSLIHI